MVINPESFMDIEEFKNKMDVRVEQTRNSSPAKGFDEVVMPGDIEERKRRGNIEEGLTLSPAIYKELKLLGEKWGYLLRSLHYYQFSKFSKS